MKVSTVTQMRALDQTAIETYGIPAVILMENAGNAVFCVLRERVGIPGRKFVVLCGGGNNGGDGFVVARKIHSDGGAVTVFILGSTDRLIGAAALNLGILRSLSIDVVLLDDLDKVARAIESCDAIVDAILGTGLKRSVEGVFRRVIEMVNASGKTVVSVDIPSGVNGDTGKVMGVAVKADCTVTFGLPKMGTLLYPGAELAGEQYVSHISFPPALHESGGLSFAINTPLPLPARQVIGHKGVFGDVLFVAGAGGYFGAPYFSAMSFLKSGGGYARLATPKSVAAIVASRGSEIVFVPQEETSEGSVSIRNLPSLLELARIVDFVVIGPGLSLDAETQQMVRELTTDIEAPILLDGDGITALCGHTELVQRRHMPTILTPHLGELARMTGLSVGAIQENLVPVSVETASKLNAYLVVKGAHTLVVYPDGRVFINLSGNDGMATAGSGDVLTGTIAAMKGLGLSLPDAVRQGVFVHGLAGDLAVEVRGRDGLTAQDILEHLPFALRAIRERLTADLLTKYGGPQVV